MDINCHYFSFENLSSPKIFSLGLLVVALPLLACASITGSQTSTPTPTPEEVGIAIQVNVTLVSYGPTASPEPEATPTPSPTILPLAPVTPLIATSTNEPEPTVTNRPVVASMNTPASSPISQDDSTDAAFLPETEVQEVYTGEISGLINQIDPAPAFLVGADEGQLEFKWRWLGDEARPCQLLDGYGFDLRIWPSVENKNLSEAQRQSMRPLGVTDAVADQDMFSDSCDPDTSTYRFFVNGLQSTPGVRVANGAGKFLWDIAYIRLEPYQVVSVSTPRDFFIEALPSDAPSPTPAPTGTLPFQATPGPQPEGTITLIAPEWGSVFPANVGPVEFRWRWDSPGQSSCELQGYGFDLRIGSPQPGFTPLGVFNALNTDARTSCDPNTGEYSHIVADLKKIDGVKATYVGEFRWDGKFVWEVALNSTNPIQIQPASTQQLFEISLNDYTGGFDPFGVPLKCSDFDSWTEAQAIFFAAGGPNEDRHDLDLDGNKIACDELRK